MVIYRCNTLQDVTVVYGFYSLFQQCHVSIPVLVHSSSKHCTEMSHWYHNTFKSMSVCIDATASKGHMMNYMSWIHTCSLPAPHTILKVKFHLYRHAGYFIIQVYVPCALLVILSWVAFWINREATADRIALGETGSTQSYFLAYKATYQR